MKIFVTGASGWVGSAVIPQLIAAGHDVVGLARSDASAATVRTLGATVARGDLDDTQVLQANATQADGVIHLAFNHDFTRFEQNVADDAHVVGVFGEALADTGKSLVIASGTPPTPGRPATESDTPQLDGAMGGRAATGQAVVALAERGVRSAVVRLPRSVHGRGDHGFIAQLVNIARTQGVSGYVGDGANRWPAVHVSDAARLFVLAVEHAPAGSILHAVGDEGVPVLDIATAIGTHLDLPVRSVAPGEIGFLGGLMSVDQPASAEQTRALLDWQPTGPGLLADIDAGHYFG